MQYIFRCPNNECCRNKLGQEEIVIAPPNMKWHGGPLCIACSRMLRVVYPHSTIPVHIMTVNGDVIIYLPNGEQVTIQYRAEHDTLNILLSQQHIAYIYSDDDSGHLIAATLEGWIAKQIIIR